MGIFDTESFCLEYLTGTTRLLEIQREFLFSLSTLSSYRELSVFLSIKKLLIPPKYSIRVFSRLDNKVRISYVLIENFPPKKEIYSKLRLLSPSRCYSHLVNPEGFNPNQSAPWFLSRTIQTRLYSRIFCLLRHPRTQCIVSTIMTEWARCCLHS